MPAKGHSCEKKNVPLRLIRTFNILKMEKRTYYLTTALLSAVMLLTGCQSKENQSNERQKVKVKVMQVVSGEQSGTSRYSGTVEEENGTALSFAVPGTIKTLHVKLGQRVTAGQLLATLDPTSMQSSYDAAKASLEQAEDAYQRMKQLHDNGSLPEIRWVETQSKLQQARSMEKIAKKNLSDCKLYAPYSGWIAEKSVEVGQNVVPGAMVTKLVTASLLNVKIAVPETEIANIPAGCKARITVPALDGRTFNGTVKEMGVVANPLSRSYDVKLRVDAPGAELMPGMVAEVALEGKTGKGGASCVIPAHIVQLDEHNNNFVWVDKDGKASKRIVQCGEFTANGVTVVSGLSGTDRVIVEGQQKVCEGTAITF